MPKRGQLGATKTLPEPQRMAVADHLERYISSLPSLERSHRKLEERLGVDIATLSKIRNRKEQAAIGINLLLKLRTALGVSIDDILGLEPLGASPLAEAWRLTDLAIDMLEEARRVAHRSLPPKGKTG